MRDGTARIEEHMFADFYVCRDAQRSDEERADAKHNARPDDRRRVAYRGEARPAGALGEPIHHP
jgi:hypothetical protein